MALTTPMAGQTPPSNKLTIVVIEGEGAIHNLRNRTAGTLAVQIEDENKSPVAGANVTFTLPSQGASGSFPHGILAMTTTDSQGKVTVSGLRPNGVAGKMEIRVTASYQGETAHATITQFNMMVEKADRKSGHGKIIVILLVAGAAAAGGIVASTNKSSSAGSPPRPSGPSPVAISITPGVGTVGPPQ